MKPKTYLLLFITIFSCSESNVSNPTTICITSPVIIGELNAGNAFNVLFLAEGFTNSEMSEFESLCETAKEAILTLEPFTSESEHINFYRVNSESVDSGVSSIRFTGTCNGETGNDNTLNTAWDVYSNRLGLSRYLGMSSEKRTLIDSLYGCYANCDYAYTITIVNSSGYYGGAEFPGVTQYSNIESPKTSNMIVSKYDSGNGFKFLVRHEFGHSFGNLDDEYVDTTTHCVLSEHTPWFIEGEPKLNVKTSNPCEWFEGARYLPKGYWREWKHSIMNSSSVQVFSPVQLSVVKQRIVEASGCDLDFL